MVGGISSRLKCCLHTSCDVTTIRSHLLFTVDRSWRTCGWNSGLLPTWKWKTVFSNVEKNSYKKILTKCQCSIRGHVPFKLFLLYPGQACPVLGGGPSDWMDTRFWAFRLNSPHRWLGEYWIFPKQREVVLKWAVFFLLNCSLTMFRHAGMQGNAVYGCLIHVPKCLQNILSLQPLTSFYLPACCT